MFKLLLIGLGGAGGSVMRYLVGGWMQKLGDGGIAKLIPGVGVFPLGTLTVNVTGCFLIGLLNVALLGPFTVREEFRIALLVGVLGGFTTFSTYGWETLSLTNDGQWLAAVSNFMLNNVLGFAAAWLGYRLAVAWFGTVS
ncbi:MAG: fluoride efflux transporter CrcB [Phycisphaeraceae bacterium]|nr:fluoride efflux transporter CrcB [Phycisphaeraceae bacterium]